VKKKRDRKSHLKEGQRKVRAQEKPGGPETMGECEDEQALKNRSTQGKSRKREIDGKSQ